MNAATIRLLEQLNIGGISRDPFFGGPSRRTVDLAAQTGGRIVGMPIWAAWQNPPELGVLRERMKLYSTTTTTKRRPW